MSLCRRRGRIRLSQRIFGAAAAMVSCEVESLQPHCFALSRFRRTRPSHYHCALPSASAKRARPVLSSETGSFLLPDGPRPHWDFDSLEESSNERRSFFRQQSGLEHTNEGYDAGVLTQARKLGWTETAENAAARSSKTVLTDAKQQSKFENLYKHRASVPDSMTQFAEEIHQHDRITRSEEIELGEKTQEALHLQRLYDNLTTKLEREPTDDEWCAAAGKINMETIRQTIEEGMEAKNKLVTSNLRMVQSVVNTYIRNGLSAQYNAGDMMQDGIVALMRAAEKFEPDRGWKFSTYAMYWVRSSVKRSQLSQSRVLRLPMHIHEDHKRLLKVERELALELKREPTRKELGQAVGMSELQVNRCFAAMAQRCYSLDQQVTNGKKPAADSAKSTTLLDLVENHDGKESDRMDQLHRLREELVITLDRYLESGEVELLLLRYGIKECPGVASGKRPTCAQLGALMGCTPDRMRTAIDRSLRKLRARGDEDWSSFLRDFEE